jgi:hypothetical protein
MECVVRGCGEVDLLASSAAAFWAGHIRNRNPIAVVTLDPERDAVLGVQP